MFFTKNEFEGRNLSLSYLREIPYWHRPGGGLVQVVEEMKKRNISNPILLDKDFIELYVASLLGMAIQVSEGLKFWIAKPRQDPPDAAMMTPRKNDRGQLFLSSREIEIVRVYDRNDVIGAILDKDRPYQKDYILVCFIEQESVVDSKQIFNQLQGKMKYISHVFLIFAGNEGVSNPDPGSVTLVQILPIVNFQTIHIGTELKKWLDDPEKLMYSDGSKLFWGLRPGEKKSPRVLYWK